MTAVPSTSGVGSPSRLPRSDFRNGTEPVSPPRRSGNSSGSLGPPEHFPVPNHRFAFEKLEVETAGGHLVSGRAPSAREVLGGQAGNQTRHVEGHLRISGRHEGQLRPSVLVCEYGRSHPAVTRCITTSAYSHRRGGQ